MPYKKLIKTLPFHADNLYNIIIDVKKYPQFIPHCSFVSVERETEREIIASMCIEYHTFLKKFEASYVSKIQLFPESHSVVISNMNNDLFNELHSSWKITPCIGGAEVIYEISFSLRNPVLNFTMSSVLMKYSDVVMEAFSKRANNILEKI